MFLSELYNYATYLLRVCVDKNSRFSAGDDLAVAIEEY